MLAQEIIHGIKKPKEGDNVVIKLNMAKAYDRVSWAYTYLVMRKMGFSVFFIEMIWRIMSNNWMLNKLYLNQNYQGFHMEPRGPQINHLSFADDVIIFTSGQRTSIQLIMKTLTTYEQVSNQLINRDKSHFMLHVDSPQGIAEMLKEEAGFTQKDNPINYLGCPLYIGGQRNIYYSHLVDKIAKRISGWQATMLNFGGRLTIVKHVLHSIPIHTMAAISPPKTTLHYIKRLTADLFWGREKDKKKYHWASWENITFPYDEGGLGVRHLNDICNSLQYKQWWHFRSTNSLWGQFLKAKYCHRANPVVKKWDTGQSLVWKYMSNNKSQVEEHIIWKINSGTCSFWWDNWLGEGPLAHHTNESNRLNNNTISQYMLNGGWNETMVRQHAPPLMIPKILSIQFQFQEGVADQPIWKLTDNGKFTCASTWENIITKRPKIKLYSYIWHRHIPFKVSFLLWRALRRKLPTNDKTTTFGVPLVKCSCCIKAGWDTIDHIFVTGHFANHFWQYH
ncbi:hypothetical protein MTR67_039451 [Solanum verrucosum]|uniref:Reverse transcriptase zinc-binding domain-containing protein n=1 Tax=Solanum verrucosum TaxID=315347 RepID=A0AAF0ZNV8_SOLVR|nr:hypothetical protein MTR67_039451 [Solanum verrucosum]